MSQQQEIELERMMRSLAVLQRLQRSVDQAIEWGNLELTEIASSNDLLFLAAELGLTKQFKQENK